MIQLFAINALVILVLLFLLWIVSLVKRDSSIIDPFWGFGFVVIAWVSWFSVQNGDGPLPARTWILLALVSLWGLRLSIYLLWRNMGHGEVYRYQAMRANAGESFWWRSLLTIFLLQGVCMLFVSLPIIATFNAATSPLSAIDILGVSIWSIGMLFESIGDYQLTRFKANPANREKVLNTGLWKYTRHPNYFGDFCVWWGHFLIAAAAGFWWTILSPVFMSFLLMKVSGVAMLEKTIANRRPKYHDYIRRTNAFFPGPPRP